MSNLPVFEIAEKSVFSKDWTEILSYQPDPNKTVLVQEIVVSYQVEQKPIIGTKEIEAADTAIALASESIPIEWVEVISETGNTGNVLVGDKNVSLTSGRVLPRTTVSSLQGLTLDGNLDLKDIYIVANNVGDGVRYIALPRVYPHLRIKFAGAFEIKDLTLRHETTKFGFGRAFTMLDKVDKEIRIFGHSDGTYTVNFTVYMTGIEQTI